MSPGPDQLARRNLGDLATRRDPEKAAVVDLLTESGRVFSYAQLDRMAQAVAAALTARGHCRGERVAIVSANRAEYLAAFNGILRAGLVAVPINFRLPAATIAFVLQDSDARLVFTDAARRSLCPATLPCIDLDAAGGQEFRAACPPAVFETWQPDGTEPAMFLYTSGSTGRPKGVVLSHASHLWVVATRLGRADLSAHRLLVAAPLYHMNALALAQLAAAAHATLVLMPQFDAGRYIEALARYRCTWLTAVPPMMAMMLREADALARSDLSSVELIRMGSAPVGATLMERLRALFPSASIQNAYGTTEAGPVVFGPHPSGLPQPELSVGYPHPEVALRLVRGEERDAAEGVLEMRSPALMSGYHMLPELTRAVMTADGYYHTGDVFRRDDAGFHYFVGREDDMFVSGGENIFPAEVEAVLETHPAVAQACVVPVEDEIKGTKPAAFVVLKLGATADEQTLRSYVLARAPAYQHPRWIWFLPALPLSGTNKVDRRALQLEAGRRVLQEHA